MPYVGKRLTTDEPLTGLVYEWADYALARIREALEAGAEPPQFRRESPWSWIYLGSAIDRDDDLRDRVVIDVIERRVEWRGPDDADDDELA